MIARPWDRDKDYDTLVKWWTDWEFGTVPKECLPPSGIVVSEDGKDICAGGLYIGEGTQFGFMEWIVTDKSAEPKTVHKCLKLCIDSIMTLAKDRGIKLYTQQPRNRLYTKGIKNTTIWFLRKATSRLSYVILMGHIRRI